MRIDRRDAESLRCECSLFCRLLTAGDATSYVTEKYIAAHVASASLGEAGLDAVDRMLLEAARGSEFALRCADMYARFFRPHGLLRRKLTLLLAIAENAPALHTRLNSAHEQTLVRACLHLAAVMMTSAGILLVSALRFAPRHLLARRESPAVVETAPVLPRGSTPHAAPPRLPLPVHHGEAER